MRCIFISGLFLLTHQLMSQVVINLQLPASSIYVKNQLWNLSLVNGSTYEPNIRVEVLLSDINTGLPVLSGTSNLVRLKKGVTQINSTSVSPITYNIINGGYNIDANPNGFLPIGIFNVCFRVIAIGEASEQLAEECDVIQIEPLGPPTLILPFDEDTVQESRPLFTWLAPTPQFFMNRPSFDLTLVEVMPTQTSSSAIQQNIPVYFQSNINFTTQLYPASYPQLDPSKLYAWQITARSNNNPVVKSEIWTFRIKKNDVIDPKVIKSSSYSRLRQINDAAFAMAKGNLNFEYANELNESSVNIKIYDLSNSRKQVPISEDTCHVHFGQNLIQYDLNAVGNFINKHIYLFELTNGRNETWYIRFEFRKED